MKKLAIAMAVALGATLAFAGGTPSTGSTTDTTTTGKAGAKGAGDTYLAKDYWDKHAKKGYLSKDDVDQFKGADGKSIDMQKLDTDNDGKVSEREWTTYHQTAGAAGMSPTKPGEGQATTK